MISESTKSLIERVINVFETGTPDGKYDRVTVMNDGKNHSAQITYGRSQTTEQGNLEKLLEMYAAHNGVFAPQISPYLQRIGRVSLVNEDNFKTLLRRAAREDPIMRQTQDEFFDTLYFKPARKFFDTNGFTRPLSLLVIYDSYIHSGRVPQFLRNKFPESPPAGGGNEMVWTADYVGVRHDWLLNNDDPVLRKTVYRTQCLKDQIAKNNWDLTILPVVANSVPVSPA